MQIRQYRASDHATVVALHVSALGATGALARRGPWDDDLDAVEATYLRAGGDFLVGEIADRVVAMGALRRKTASVVEIKRMRVQPELQRRGYGGAMLNALLERASDLGFTEVVLDTTTRQQPAISFYIKHGFIEMGRESREEMEMVFFWRLLSTGGSEPK